MRLRIRLDTVSDASAFATIASGVDGRVVITDGNGLCVNGKSVLGALHALEFSELWCESDKEIYGLIRDFVVE